MLKVSLFAEDYGHRSFLVPLLEQVAAQYDLELEVLPFTATGGFGRVETELERYVQDLLRFRQDLPDLVVVGRDANCEGFIERRKHLQQITEPVKDRVVFAVPDPHIERWMLIDAAAFKKALGAPCRAPDQKCDRGRYKRLLAEAVEAAGLRPLIGGMEHASDVVAAMRLGPTTRKDDFGTFLQELHSFFRGRGSSG